MSRNKLGRDFGLDIAHVLGKARYCRLPIANCRLKCSESRVPHPPIGNWQSEIGNPKSKMRVGLLIQSPFGRRPRCQRRWLNEDILVWGQVLAEECCGMSVEEKDVGLRSQSVPGNDSIRVHRFDVHKEAVKDKHDIAGFLHRTDLAQGSVVGIVAGNSTAGDLRPIVSTTGDGSGEGNSIDGVPIIDELLTTGEERSGLHSPGDAAIAIVGTRGNAWKNRQVGMIGY